MRVVFSHPSPTVANAARDQLLSRGILSSVVSRTEAIWARVTAYDVMLCFSAQAAAAQAILAEPEWRAPADEGWEEDELADLSLLDPALAPDCPACGEKLPLEPGLDSCPACGHEVDVAELIVARHGPEALEPCYDDPAPPLNPEAIERLTLLCPNCQYSLDGLPRAGICPECGREYDKDRIVREFLSA